MITHLTHVGFESGRVMCGEPKDATKYNYAHAVHLSDTAAAARDICPHCKAIWDGADDDNMTDEAWDALLTTHYWTRRNAA